MRIDPTTGLDLDDPEQAAFLVPPPAAPPPLVPPTLAPPGPALTHAAPDPFTVVAPPKPPPERPLSPEEWAARVGTPGALPPDPAPPPPAEPPPPAAASAVAPAAPTVESSKQEVERTVLSPESKAAMAAGAQASQGQVAAAERSAAAAKAKNVAEGAGTRAELEADASARQDEAKILERQEAEHQLLQARHQAALAKADAKIEAAQKRVDADLEKSQKSYWADKSTGFTIIMSLLEGSSARDSTILGQDPANNMVTRKIGEAVAADKAKKLAQYQRSKEYLAEAKKGPEAANEALQNARADIDAATHRQLQITLKKADALKSSKKLNPDRLQANIDAANAAADAELAQTRQEAAGREIARTAVTNRKVSTTTATAPAQKPGTDVLVYGEGGKPIARARTPKEAEAANKANAGFRQLDGVLGALEQSYRANGVAYNPLSDTKQDQNALKGAATIAFKNAAQLGAISGADQVLIDKAIGGAWTGKQGVAKLRAAREALARGHAATLDTMGLPGKDLTGQLRAGGGAQPQAQGEPSLGQLKRALQRASEAGDKQAVSAIRRRIAVSGSQ